MFRKLDIDYVAPNNGDVSFKAPSSWGDYSDYSNPPVKSMRDRQLRMGVTRNRSTGLLELDLSRRSLEEIPSEAFNFSRIEALKIGNNKIKGIPNAIGHMHRLKVLDAHNNAINSLPDTIVNCDYLSNLNLSKNHLSTLPVNLKNMKNVTVLCLAHNQFETLPHDVANLESLKTLDMQGNKLWHLPFNIQNMRNLRNLNIGENQFEHVPTPVCNIKNLENFNAKGNRLMTLPTDFENLKLLKELNISHNQFEAVPYVITEMRTLQFLNMAHNQINYIPPRLTRMAKLKTLHVQHNEIVNVPNCFDNLEYFNISHNKIRNFSIAKMKKLKMLNASHNDLENLPMGLCNLSQLEQVYMSNNQIRFISQDVVLLKNVKTLDLSYNKLTSLPQVINELEKLEYFSIKGNKIQARPQVINSHKLYVEEMNMQQTTDDKRKSLFNWVFGRTKRTEAPMRQRKPLDDRFRKSDGHSSAYPRNKVVDYLEGAGKPRPGETKQVRKEIRKPTRVFEEDMEQTEVKMPLGTPPPSTNVKRAPSDQEDSLTIDTNTTGVQAQNGSVAQKSEDITDVSIYGTQATSKTDFALIGLCNQVEALLNRDLLQPIISHKANYRHNRTPSPRPSDISQTTETTQSTKLTMPTTINASNNTSTIQPTVIVRDPDTGQGQAWLLRMKSETFTVTQYGGTFKSKVDPNIKLFFPASAVSKNIEITIQIEKVDQECLVEARQRSDDKLLNNLIAVGDIVHVEQSSKVNFEQPVSIVIPAPPSIKYGKMHILSYKGDNTCSISTAPYRQQTGYVTVQTWHLAGGKGAVLTKAKCKHKACRSVELLLNHLYI